MTDHRHWKAQETLTERIHRVGWSESASGCWEWAGFVEPRGYAKVMHGGTSHRVHRVMLNHSTPAPSPELLACHTCDNRRCINPAHLYWGTHAENTADMLARNGAGSGRPAQLTDAQVAEIASAYAAGGTSMTSLGKSYGVSRTTVYRIVHGQRTGATNASR